jgi:hypothetical protein
MKHISEYNHSNHKEQVAITQHNIGQMIPPDVLNVLDDTIEALQSIYPSWRAGFKEDDEIIGYKQQLAIAMIENKINTHERIGFGLAVARHNNHNFMPTVGVFITWCKEKIKADIDKKKMIASTERILDERRLLGNGTFEARQAEARSEISKIREILKHPHKQE